MNTHTPGPWHVGKKHPCRIIATGRPLDIALACLEQDDDGESHTGEQAANARLIAAAPTMLDALEELMAHPGLWGAVMNAWIDQPGGTAKAKQRKRQ